MTIRIAFYVYPTAFQNPGGGEVQLLKTKEYLEKKGLTITLFNPWTDRLKDFDILHTFGSVKDALPMMREAKRLGVKNVLSTICWYSFKSAWGASDKLTAKTAALIRHAAKEFCPLIPSDRKEMISISDCLLPNSQSEADQLRRYFHASQDKIRIIPNAVDEKYQFANPDLFHNTYGKHPFVLVVGRIEPRKNQLLMVRALRNIPVQSYFIGDYVSSYKSYYEQCLKEAGPKTVFLGSFPNGSELLKSAYAACHVFLLASWLETPGLAALEAGIAGANIVITQEGATREYFQDYADYVDPSNVSDIEKKVRTALEKKHFTELIDHIKDHFSWDTAASKTLEAYHSVCKAH